jgi:hypothetical protein
MPEKSPGARAGGRRPGRPTFGLIWHFYGGIELVERYDMTILQLNQLNADQPVTSDSTSLMRYCGPMCHCGHTPEKWRFRIRNARQVGTSFYLRADALLIKGSDVEVAGAAGRTSKLLYFTAT